MQYLWLCITQVQLWDITTPGWKSQHFLRYIICHLKWIKSTSDLPTDRPTELPGFSPVFTSVVCCWIIPYFIKCTPVILYSTKYEHNQHGKSIKHWVPDPGLGAGVGGRGSAACTYFQPCSFSESRISFKSWSLFISTNYHDYGLLV